MSRKRKRDDGWEGVRMLRSYPVSPPNQLQVVSAYMELEAAGVTVPEALERAEALKREPAPWRPNAVQQVILRRLEQVEEATAADLKTMTHTKVVCSGRGYYRALRELLDRRVVLKHRAGRASAYTLAK